MIHHIGNGTKNNRSALHKMLPKNCGWLQQYKKLEKILMLNHTARWDKILANNDSVR